jgi:hypothetical protein
LLDETVMRVLSSFFISIALLMGASLHANAAPIAKTSRQGKTAKSAKKTRKPVAKPVAANEIFDLARINFNKCVQIEKLANRKSAVKCMDRLLDRMDSEVGNVEAVIATCGEARRLENYSNHERASKIQSYVRDVMMTLRKSQESLIDSELAAYEKTGVTVGPRRMKEIEMRATVSHMKAARKFAGLVCSRVAFERALNRK